MILIYNANIILTDKILPGYVVVEGSKIKSVGFDGIPYLPFDRKIYRNWQGCKSDLLRR